MKYVQKHLWKEHLCALQVFLCVLISQLVCTRTCAQLRAVVLNLCFVRRHLPGGPRAKGISLSFKDINP